MMRMNPHLSAPMCFGLPNSRNLGMWDMALEMLPENDVFIAVENCICQAGRASSPGLAKRVTP